MKEYCHAVRLTSNIFEEDKEKDNEVAKACGLDKNALSLFHGDADRCYRHNDDAPRNHCLKSR